MYEILRTNSDTLVGSYALTYEYDDADHPTAPMQIGHEHYTFDAYLPYGELLVDEHSSSEEMQYKFNGKEFDQETGLYYYGARYMNPRTSLWYGVDPLAEKYPNIGGYAYCAGNPIKLIDTDGRKIKGVTRHDAQTFREDIHGVLFDEKFGKVTIQR